MPEILPPDQEIARLWVPERSHTIGCLGCYRHKKREQRLGQGSRCCLRFSITNSIKCCQACIRLLSSTNPIQLTHIRLITRALISMQPLEITACSQRSYDQLAYLVILVLSVISDEVVLYKQFLDNSVVNRRHRLLVASIELILRGRHCGWVPFTCCQQAKQYQTSALVV